MLFSLSVHVCLWSVGCLSREAEHCEQAPGRPLRGPPLGSDQPPDVKDVPIGSGPPQQRSATATEPNTNTHSHSDDTSTHTLVQRAHGVQTSERRAAAAAAAAGGASGLPPLPMSRTLMDLVPPRSRAPAPPVVPVASLDGEATATATATAGRQHTASR